MLNSTPSSSFKFENPVRIGVLSIAAILSKGVMQGMQRARGLEVCAVASRTLEKAQAYATEHGIGKAYGSYEAMLADSEIEAVYIPLPNHLHVPWALAAAQAGKHVLCEKPFGLCAAQLQTLVPYAHRVHLVEAVMVRHHPQWHYAKALLDKGDLGELRTVQGHFSYYNMNAENIRNRLETGGGALLDIGIYPIVAARYFFAAEPIAVTATIERSATFGTDIAVSAVVDFGAGRHLLMSAATQAVRYQSLSLVGTQAQLDMDLPFNPPLDQATTMQRSEGNQLRAQRQTITVAACNQYQLQAEHFAHQVRHTTPSLQSLQDAAAIARIMDAIVLSAANGCKQPVADAATPTL